jgi:hypothetical protein
MNHKSKPIIPASIVELQRQLDQFRSTQPRPTRLPESLCQAAVELARQHGVYSVTHPSTPESPPSTIPLQVRALREYAARRAWAVTMQVGEIGSGASARKLREKIVEAARRRDIDVVLVWRLDRWVRSVTDLLAK